MPPWILRLFLSQVERALSTQFAQQPVPSHYFDRGLMMLQRIAAVLEKTDRYTAPWITRRPMLIHVLFLNVGGGVTIFKVDNHTLCYLSSASLQQRQAWLAELVYKPLREGVLEVFGDQDMPAAAAHLLAYLLHPSNDGGAQSLAWHISNESLQKLRCLISSPCSMCDCHNWTFRTYHSMQQVLRVVLQAPREVQT